MSNWKYLKEFIDKRSWDVEFHATLVSYIVNNMKNLNSLNLLFPDATIVKFWADMLAHKDLTFNRFALILDQIMQLLCISLKDKSASEISEKVCNIRLSKEILLGADRVHVIQGDSTYFPIVRQILSFYELALQDPKVAKVIAKQKQLETFLQVLFSPVYDNQRTHLNTELIIMCFHHLLFADPTVADLECKGPNVPYVPSKITTISS
jgi:hypothetical protein